MRATALLFAASLVVVSCGDDDESASSASTTTTVAPATTTLPAIEGLEIDDDLTNRHVADPVYDDLPPMGGDHIEIWANCAFHGVNLPLGNIVHTLEHGVVWLAYGPDVSPGDQGALANVYADNPDRLIASLVPELGDEIWAVAWGRRVLLDGPDDPRLDAFIAAFLDGPQAPEPGVTCQGGIG